MKKLHILAVSLLAGLAANAQTTIAQFDFNGSSSLPVSAASTASNITASVNGTQANAAYGGTTTGSSAFTQITTAGNALSMSNSSGTNTNYWTLTLGGSALNTYINYKIYFQTEHSSTGATAIDIYYSTDGSTYTALSQTVTPGLNNSYTEAIVDLSGITTLNNQTAVYVRFAASGGTGSSGTLRMDNLEIQAATSPWTMSGGNVNFTGGISATSFTTTGDARINGNLTASGIASTSSNLTVSAPATFNSTIKSTSLAGTGSRILLTDANGLIGPLSAGTSSQVLFGNGTWAALPTQAIQTSGSNAYFTGGNFGIGNSSPSYSLDVNGSARIVGAVTTNSIAVSSLAGGGSFVPLFVDNDGNLRTTPATGVNNPFTGTIGYWNLRGNSQTDTTYNFIGTTDDKDLIFKTNNVERMRITSHHANNREEGRVYIGGGSTGNNDIITINNDLPGNWDDKLVVKDALRIVNDNAVPSKCALFGNDGVHTYIESFDINTPDQPGYPYVVSPDDIIIGYSSGANVSIYSTRSDGGYLNVQRTITVGNNIGIGSDASNSNSQLLLRGTGDLNHGLGWFSSFNNNATAISIDGPVLYGYSGGALATKDVISNTPTTKIAFKWDNSGNITLPNYGNSNNNLQSLLVDANGNLVKGAVVGSNNAVAWAFGGNGTNASAVVSSIGTTDGNDLPFVTNNVERVRITSTGNIAVVNDNQILLSGNDAHHGLGAFGANSSNSAFAGKSGINGPVLYGFNGGALGYTGAAGANPNGIALLWDATGAVHVGKTSPQAATYSSAKLTVDGTFVAKEIYVVSQSSGNWADYVFKKDYKLMPLTEVEKYINQNQHLPNVPSATEVETKGQNLGELQVKQMEKIEEMYLYMIEVNKKVQKLEEENSKLKMKVSLLEDKK